MAKPSSSTSQEIPISELVPGMYITALTHNKNDVKMRSEGYIKTKVSIDKLISAGIKSVIVDPSKTKGGNKSVVQAEPQVEEPQTQEPIDDKPKVHIDHEINRANELVKDAAELKNKILDSIKENKKLDISIIEDNTNAVVDSVFRNQDALTCMTQLKDKSNYLVDHALNCSILMAIFAKHLRFEEEVIKELTLGAFLHDVGKVFLDDKLLNKRTSLTDDEQKRLSKHVAFGAKVLEGNEQVSDIAMAVVTEHHERIDGSGYPRGLTADEISQYGKMMAIVDNYDIMTSDRPGHKRIFPPQVYKVLAAESDEFYDEELVNEFIQALGVYPVGTLVKLTSGKLGIISQGNRRAPLTPFVRVFYNTRMNQAIPIRELDLSKSRTNDQIECCIKPEEFNINLLDFFKKAFMH